jgi:CHAD domain-containing protein
MPPKPTLRPQGPIGTALAAVARDIFGEARAALADRRRSDAEHIHDFRKALKRWRALLRLLEPPLGEAARTLRKSARELARSLTRTRDAQSALDALDGIEKEAHTFSKHTLATLRQRLLAIRRRRERATHEPVLRRRLRLRLNAAERVAQRWTLDQVDFDTVAAGLTETYRRARRAIPGTWSHATAEELHELRKRVVEHRYQMELVESLWPRFGKLWVEETQRLRSRLGAHQDLAVLAGLAAPHRPLAHWRSRLAPLIAKRQADHVAAAARVAGRLFAERPKAFRRRLSALWESRGR